MRRVDSNEGRLGARGWVRAGGYNLERYLYLLHRVTGLGLILYGLLHLTATTVFRIQGQGVWEATMSFLDAPWFKAGEYVLLVAFVFHALNGLRLTLQELGFGLSKPKPPVYPYPDALCQARPLTLVVLAVIVIVCALFLFDFLWGGW